MSDPHTGPTTVDEPGRGEVVTADDDEREQRSFLAELPVLVLVAFILALVLKTFLVQAFFIPSSSMEPTLLIGDRVLVNKVVYKVREPRRGEIVVFTDEDAGVQPEGNPVIRFLRSMSSGLGLTQPGEKDFIKRIIGLPGDTIEMRDGVVTVNGEPLPEAPASEGGYLSSRDLTPFEPTVVPDGHYFMMGDNRPNSADSRFTLGPIPAEHVVGRAFVVIWPVRSARLLRVPDYAEPVAVGRAPAPAAAEQVAAATIDPMQSQQAAGRVALARVGAVVR